MKSVLDMRKDKEREEFLKLAPLERAETMHRVLLEVIHLRAKAEGVTEYEIYRRYLKDNPRHYQRLSV